MRSSRTGDLQKVLGVVHRSTSNRKDKYILHTRICGMPLHLVDLFETCVTTHVIIVRRSSHRQLELASAQSAL